MYRYAQLKTNDIANGEGICVSFWMQGCPHHCPGCFNPETWDFSGGQPLPKDIKEQIVSALTANNIQRNFSILGGEPLCNENKELTKELVSFVRQQFPSIIIYIWSGYYYQDLVTRQDETINYILDNINILIDGPFIESQKDLTLKLRGSTNQHIINLAEIKKICYNIKENKKEINRMTTIDSGLTLYDINKQAMAQVQPLDTIAFNVATHDLVQDISFRAAHGSPYWMLLCRERSDYTVFNVQTLDGTLTELRPTLKNRGEVLEISQVEDQNYEIWIRDPETKENFVYYLFDYTYGVITA